MVIVHWTITIFQFVKIFKNCLCQLSSCANHWKMYDFIFEICPYPLLTSGRWFLSKGSCNRRFVEIFKNCVYQLSSSGNQWRIYDFISKFINTHRLQLEDGFDLSGSSAMAALPWQICYGGYPMAVIYWHYYRYRYALVALLWHLHFGSFAMAAMLWRLYSGSYAMAAVMP